MTLYKHFWEVSSLTKPSVSTSPSNIRKLLALEGEHTCEDPIDGWVCCQAWLPSLMEDSRIRQKLRQEEAPGRDELKPRQCEQEWHDMWNQDLIFLRLYNTFISITCIFHWNGDPIMHCDNLSKTIYSGFFWSIKCSLGYHKTLLSLTL